MNPLFEPRGIAPRMLQGQPQPISEQLLLRNMRAFAHNNVRFRRGDVDRLSLYMRETTEFTVPEIITPEQAEIMREWDDENDPATSEIEVSYQFMAQRAKIGTQAVVAFMMQTEASHSYIELPSYVARQLTSAPEDIGPVTLTKSFDFNIATNVPYLHACESFEYTDDDEDAIYGGCSCENESSHEPFYVPLVDQEQYADGQVVQVVTNPVSSRLANEFIPPQSPEDAVALWASMPRFDLGVEEHMYDANLCLAYNIFQRFKALFREQAGIR